MSNRTDTLQARCTSLTACLPLLFVACGSGTDSGHKIVDAGSVSAGASSIGGSTSPATTKSTGGIPVGNTSGTISAGGSSIPALNTSTAGTTSFITTQAAQGGVPATGGASATGSNSPTGGASTLVTTAASSGLGGTSSASSGGVTSTTGGLASGGTSSSSTSGNCPTGSAVSQKTGLCFVCSPTMVCGATGETGKIHPLTAIFGTQETCICETSPGYFYSRSQNVTEPCDKDNDGWVRDSAIAAINDSDQAVRDSMRCTVRMASQIVLHSENTQVTNSSVPIYFTGTSDALQATLTAPEASKAAALPLYESVRNDDDSKLQSPSDPGVPAYGTRHLADSERNSLTKACITPTADHNDNSIPDVQEWARFPDKSAPMPSIADLRAPYVPVYNQLSYYVELNKAWFEFTSTDASTKTQTGVYHIQERNRAAAASDGVGIIANPSRNSEYWRSCQRNEDSLYSVETNPNTLDFASLDSTSWTGMRHHSQFKCIQAVANDDPVTGLDANAQKSQFYKQTLAAIQTNTSWDINNCTLGSAPTPGATPNPVTPLLACSIPDTNSPLAKDQVRWVVMSYQDYPTSGDYVRGCINECLDTNPTIAQCYECKAGTYGQATQKAVDAAGHTNTTTPPCSAPQMCDGNGHCGDCIPGTLQCKDATNQQICNTQRTWQDNVACIHGCASAADSPVSGQCYPDCSPGDQSCSTGTHQSCDNTGHWANQGACPAGYECVTGTVNCLKSDGQACTQPSECAVGVCTTFYSSIPGASYGTPANFCGSSPPSGYMLCPPDHVVVAGACVPICLNVTGSCSSSSSTPCNGSPASAADNNDSTYYSASGSGGGSSGGSGSGSVTVLYTLSTFDSVSSININGGFGGGGGPSGSGGGSVTVTVTFTNGSSQTAYTYSAAGGSTTVNKSISGPWTDVASVSVTVGGGGSGSSSGGGSGTLYETRIYTTNSTQFGVCAH